MTAIISGRDGVRELARRCLRWRVPLRWYAIALLAPPAALLATVTALYGLAPLRALAAGLAAAAHLVPAALVVMVVFYSVAEEAGWTGFLFARLQDRHGPMRAALVTTVFFWLFHLPTFLLETGSWALTAGADGLPAAAAPGQPLHRRVAVQRHWVQRADRRTVPCDVQLNVNPTGFALGVLKLPSDEAFVVLNAMVIIAGVVVVVATRGRLGLRSDDRERTPSRTP